MKRVKTVAPPVACQRSTRFTTAGMTLAVVYVVPFDLQPLTVLAQPWPVGGVPVVGKTPPMLPASRGNPRRAWSCCSARHVFAQCGPAPGVYLGLLNGEDRLSGRRGRVDQAIGEGGQWFDSGQVS
jgi:hypothetical protein